MPITSKRIYDEAQPGDGMRVLATNYWPRGISRARAGIYKRLLAPSRELLRSFKEGEIEWDAFERAYLEEMRGDQQREEIRALSEEAREGTVTVMCVCEDESHCHRRLLRQLIQKQMRVKA